MLNLYPMLYSIRYKCIVHLGRGYKQSVLNQRRFKLRYNKIKILLYIALLYLFKLVGLYVLYSLNALKNYNWAAFNENHINRFLETGL